MVYGVSDRVIWFFGKKIFWWLFYNYLFCVVFPIGKKKYGAKFIKYILGSVTMHCACAYHFMKKSCKNHLQFLTALFWQPKTIIVFLKIITFPKCINMTVNCDEKRRQSITSPYCRLTRLSYYIHITQVQPPPDHGGN